ncbi:MAG: hypothetical protein QF752_14690 [Planctomycetota bacterium]|nr:hypothetical protein [Planctomycetota bacterium]
MTTPQPVYTYIEESERHSCSRSELVSELIRGGVDLSTPIIGPFSELPRALDRHPEVIHAFLEQKPDHIGAPELRERITSNRCLHCHKKGAQQWTRHSIQSLLWTRETRFQDWSCVTCRTWKNWSGLLQATLLGWWGWPGIFRTPIVLGHLLNSLLRTGHPYLGIFRAVIGIGLIGLPISLMVFLSIALDHQSETRGLTQARQLLEQNRPAEAILILEPLRLQTSSPNTLQINHLIGVARLRLGHPHRAIEALKRAQDHPPVQWDLGRALIAAGRVEEAWTLYRDILQRTPSLRFHKAYQNLGIQLGKRFQLQDEYREGTRNRPDDPSAHFLEGRLELNPSLRLQAMEKALKLNPRFASALQIAAPSAIRLGDLEQTAHYLLRARTLQERGELEWAALLEANVLLERDLPSDALECLQPGTSTQPDLIGTFPLRLEALLSLEQIPNARKSLATLEGVLGKSAPSVAWYRGLINRHSGSFESAIRSFQNMLESLPHPGRSQNSARRALIRTYLEADEIDHALEELDLAAQKPQISFDAPYWIATHRILAHALAGRWEKTREIWNRSLLELPDVARSSAHGSQLLLLQDPQKIASRLEFKRNGMPRLTHNDHYLYAGLACHLLGQSSQARRYWKQSIASSRGQDYPRRLAQRLLER